MTKKLSREEAEKVADEMIAISEETRPMHECAGNTCFHTDRHDTDLKPTPALLGTCDICGQEMILTDDDCWHPWNVERECPGSGFGRPGREHFVPLEG